MSVASTIIQNLETKLKTIKKSGSYDVTVKRVEKFDFSPDARTENQPSIAILAGEDTIVVRDSSHVRRHWEIALAVYVSDYTNPQNIIQELVDDIHVLIYAPINLGSNCLAVEILNTSDVFVDDESKEAGAVLNLMVVYYATLASF